MAHAIAWLGALRCGGKLPQMRKLRIVIYVGIAALITAHCYRYPMYDVDLLSYAGNVALFGTSDPVQVHRVVYQYPLTSHLRGLDKTSRSLQN